MKKIILKKGRDESLIRRHPWIFSGGVKSADENLINGELTDVFSFDGKWLAKAFYSPASQLRARVLSFNQNEIIDIVFFRNRIIKAINFRKNLKINSNAYRLIHSESDNLPGLIVDYYNNILSCQFHSTGINLWKDEIIKILIELFNPIAIFDKSDEEICTKEGISCNNGLIYGESDGKIVITENAIKFNVDIINGHKTGYYLDQRDNRLILSEYCENKSFLNCFSYTGGFGLFAAKGNASHITNMDISDSALNIAKDNILLNDFEENKFENVQADVFKLLRTYRDSRKEFDVIVLDPPKFASSSSQLEGALRGYKDINLLALKLLKPGGILMTFSCSGHITNDLFHKMFAGAAIDSKKYVKILKYLSQSPDHPILMNFPESNYLKGILSIVE